MTDATWAGRSAKPPTPAGDDDRAGWLPVAGVIAALGLVGVGGYLLGSSDDPASATAAAVASTTVEVEPTNTTDEIIEDPGATPPSSTSDGSVVGDETSADQTSANDTARSDTSTDDTSTDDTSTDDAPSDDDASRDGSDDLPNQVIVEEGEVRGALLRDGVLYLGGTVPSQDVADQIIERAEAVIGEGNVVSEYVIEPGAEMGQGAPLAIDDVVLFAYGANTYDPQFEPLLDLGLLLLSQNPSVVVTIITHTDTSGSAAYNDLLSYQRGQSVAQYWVDRGIPVEQIVIDARGEREPRAEDHDGGDAAQLNRRAEFFIAGLLP